MNKKLKKSLSLLLALVLLSGALATDIGIYGADDVIINSTNFSDDGFRTYVSTLDKDNNGALSPAERNISIMSISGYAAQHPDLVIKNLRGIEFFASSLTTLRCAKIGLESLDVSRLTKLVGLSCMANSLTSLDVSANTRLERLDCSDNNISSLRLGSNKNLWELYCQINSLTAIDVSGLPALEIFSCYQNELERLNVTKNTQLTVLSCASNHLRSLDLSYNSMLSAISSADIGDQTVTVEAEYTGSLIRIPFGIDKPTMITATSFDTADTSGYVNGYFSTDNVNNLSRGILYYYSVGNTQVEDMDVTINVTRNFYQVDFYSDSGHTRLLSRSFANANTPAAQPQPFPTAPQCKAFDRWSADISNVTDDLEIYPVWRDSHAFALKSFINGKGTIECPNCGYGYAVNFKDYINKTDTDDFYCEYLDVVNDGVINAKDYAQLKKMFR